MSPLLIGVVINGLTEQKKERKREESCLPCQYDTGGVDSIDLQPQMTAENSAIIMTNERKSHRMEEENVNTSSPKKKLKVAGIGHCMCLYSGYLRHTQ